MHPARDRTLSTSVGRTLPSTINFSSLGTMFRIGLAGGTTPPTVCAVSPITLPPCGATMRVRRRMSRTATSRSRVSNHSCCASREAVRNLGAQVVLELDNLLARFAHRHPSRGDLRGYATDLADDSARIHADER